MLDGFVILNTQPSSRRAKIALNGAGNGADRYRLSLGGIDKYDSGESLKRSFQFNNLKELWIRLYSRLADNWCLMTTM
jgi:hypothetical protein